MIWLKFRRFGRQLKIRDAVLWALLLPGQFVCLRRILREFGRSGFPNLGKSFSQMELVLGFLTASILDVRRCFRAADPYIRQKSKDRQRIRPTAP
jgi:hypothetical protein